MGGVIGAAGSASLLGGSLVNKFAAPTPLIIVDLNASKKTGGGGGGMKLNSRRPARAKLELSERYLSLTNLDIGSGGH